MASSPLRRPLSRASTRSSSSTQYELDVDALLNEKDDDTFSIDVASKNDAKDKIFSDDIDGPTDFTQNLEFWMRGGQWLKNKMKAESRAVQTMQAVQVGTAQKPRENYTEKLKVVETLETQKAPTAQLKWKHFTHNMAQPSPSRSEPKFSESDSLPKLNEQGPGAESDSEDDSIPIPIPRPKSSLQPSVEDYNSTPVRPWTARSASSSALGDTLRKSIARRLKETQAQNLDQGRNVEDATVALQKTIDTLRTELRKCKTDASAERTRLLSEFERRRENYQRDVDDGAKEKDALIARLNHELSQHKQDAQSLRAQNASLQLQFQEQLLRNDGLRQTLNYQVSASKRKSDAQTLSNRRQIEELRKQHRLDLDRQHTSYEARFSTYESRLAIQPSLTHPPSQPLPAPSLRISTSELEAQLTTLQSHLTAANTTISSLRIELSQSSETILVLQSQAAQEKQQTIVLNQHNQAVTNQLNAVREEVAEVRSQLLSVEIERDLAETAREDLEEQCSALEARLKDLAAIAEGDRTGSRVQELVVKMGQVQAEKALLEERVDELEEQILGAEERINELERERDGIAQNYEERIEVSERASRMMAEEIKGARMTVKERDGLKASLAAYEMQLLQQKSELESARTDAQRATEEVRTLSAEIEMLKREFDEMNKAMDKKVKEMMDQRDLEWIKRIEGLDRERKIMGSVLLREWGRGEFGKIEPQAYRYKYALRQEV